MKAREQMKNEIVDPEVECLKLKKQINDNHRLTQTAAGEAVDRGILTGELLGEWKRMLPHGRFESFVGEHFIGSLRTAQVYMQAVKRLNGLSKSQRTALLNQERSIAGLIGKTESTRGDGAGAVQDSRESGPVPPVPPPPNIIPDDPGVFGDPFEVELHRDEPPPKPPDPGTIKCPACDGTGRVTPIDHGGGFNEFWTAILGSKLPQYARMRKSRGAAEKAYKGAVKRLSAEGYSDPDGHLRMKVGLFCASGEANAEGAKFCQLAATWLKAERYLEEPEQWVKGGKDLNAGM